MASKQPKLLVKSAIKTLADRDGSSVHDIIKYLRSGNPDLKDEKNYRLRILKTIKQGMYSGQLEQSKMLFKVSKQQSNVMKKQKATKTKPVNQTPESNAIKKRKSLTKTSNRGAGDC